MGATVDATEVRWNKDIENAERALAPWAVTIDGAQFVSPEAPRPLADVYQSLVSVGYARGWFR